MKDYLQVFATWIDLNLWQITTQFARFSPEHKLTDSMTSTAIAVWFQSMMGHGRRQFCRGWLRRRQTAAALLLLFTEGWCVWRIICISETIGRHWIFFFFFGVRAWGQYFRVDSILKPLEKTLKETGGAQIPLEDYLLIDFRDCSLK